MASIENPISGSIPKLISSIFPCYSFIAFIFSSLKQNIHIEFDIERFTEDVLVDV